MTPQLLSVKANMRARLQPRSYAAGYAASKNLTLINFPFKHCNQITLCLVLPSAFANARTSIVFCLKGRSSGISHGDEKDGSRLKFPSFSDSECLWSCFDDLTALRWGLAMNAARWFLSRGHAQRAASCVLVKHAACAAFMLALPTFHVGRPDIDKMRSPLKTNMDSHRNMFAFLCCL